jgi:hypothetical protein
MKTTSLLRTVATQLSLAAFCVFSAIANPAVAGDANAPAPYASMAPIEQYLMEANTEIALAKSAAPSAISAKATVLVLKRNGYETAVAGTNGFTCLVERAWMSPFDDPEFWNAKKRGPVCYNPAAAKSVLKYTLWRTKRALEGHSKEKLLEETRAAVTAKELPPPATGAMSYMMSKDQYLADGAGHWHSHLMFHIPKVDAATWGANVPGSPVIFDNREMPEQAIFMVPVAHWSDGTDAQMPGM